MYPLEITDEKIIYEGYWFKVLKHHIKLPDGKQVDWDTIMADDAVFVVALDSEKNVLLVKEWRAPHKKFLVEIVGGNARGCETEEDLLNKAREELREELGLDSKNISKIGTVLRGGRMGGTTHFYVAKDLYPSPKDADEGELIEVVRMPFSRALKYYQKGGRSTIYTLLGLLLAKNHLTGIPTKNP